MSLHERNNRLRERAEEFYTNAARRAVEAAAKTGVTHIKAIMTPPAPSNPGEPPAVRKGRLRRMMGYLMNRSGIAGVLTGYGIKTVSARIGPDDSVPYGRIMELGGPVKATNKPFLVFMGDFDGSLHKMKEVYIRPRPYLRRGLHRAWIDLLKIQLPAFFRRTRVSR